MVTIVVIVVCVVIYYIVGLTTDKEQERQRKQDPLNRESLEKYTIKKNLFLLFNDYLYSNIEEFKSINDFKIIRSKIENDFPNYGEGIYGTGIISDLIRYNLFYKNLKERVVLGKTFQIISISYPNYKIFCEEIYNSEFKMRYSEGGYYSEFGDEITKIVFYVELNESRLYVGLSEGDYNMRYFEKRHNVKTDEDEMYLFCELQVNKNPPHNYPYFDLVKLRKDIPVKDYHSYFKKYLDISKVISTK
jgi:hypothetical protein